MSDPNGAAKVRYSIQEVLARAFDAANDALRMSATLEASDIQIGAVELKNHDTPDRAYIDPQHYLHTRSVTRLYGGGTPVDVSDVNPMPVDVRTALSAYVAAPSDWFRFSKENDATKPSGIYDGVKTVAAIATPEALHADQAIKHSVVVQAASTNTQAIFVGNSGSQSLELTAGESTRVYTDNLNKVYIRVLVNGEKANYDGS